jgi:AraC-like DNA-binding protein
LTGALFFVVHASSPWVAEAPAGDLLAPVILPTAQHLVSYHLVMEGGCWCVLPGELPVRVEAGDVLVIPHGDRYLLSTGRRPEDLEAPLDEILAAFRQLASGELPFVVEEGGGGPERLRVACGFLGCDVAPFNPVLAALPRLLHVRASDGTRTDRLRRLLDIALAEARERPAGSQCVLLRLSELLFIEVVRTYFAALPGQQVGWLAGLRDPLVGRALRLLHEQPAAAWSLTRLARTAGCSRSVLAERFTKLVGQPPMQYLACWRMQLAARHLEGGDAKIAAVAGEVGYESEAAFSRAFKRAVGMSPAAWRRRTVAP